MVMVWYHDGVPIQQNSEVLAKSLSIDCAVFNASDDYQAYWAPSPSNDTWDTIGADEYEIAFGARTAGADE